MAVTDDKIPFPTSPYAFMQNYGSESQFHIGLNVDPLSDIWTGTYVKNKEGVWFLNGGCYAIMALAGGNNTQKTGKAVYDVTRLLYRFKTSMVIYYDTESTLDIERLARSVDEMFGIEDYFYDHIMDKRFIYMPALDDIDGTVLHNRVKEIYTNIKEMEISKDSNMKKAYNNMLIETPIWASKTNKYLSILPPLVLVCDSVTEVSFDKLIFKQFDEGDIDAGGKKRTRDLELGNLRRVLMEDTCKLGPRVGMCSYWIAQTGKKFSMDGKPMEKDTVFINQDKKYDAPKTFRRAPYLGIEILKATVLDHKDGGVMYPSKKYQVTLDSKQNPDMMIYTARIFRNKMGKSGGIVYFIGTQRGGINSPLSMYHTLKVSNYYGMTGSKQAHRCVLYPDVVLGRKSISDLLDDDPRLVTAITFCYHLWFAQNHWANLPEDFRIPPEEVYQKVVDQGIDWNELLDTVDFWHDNAEFIQKPTLTLYELLEIAVNKKPIYWKNK